MLQTLRLRLHVSWRSVLRRLTLAALVLGLTSPVVLYSANRSRGRRARPSLPPLDSRALWLHAIATHVVAQAATVPNSGALHIAGDESLKALVLFLCAPGAPARSLFVLHMFRSDAEGDCPPGCGLARV